MALLLSTPLTSVIPARTVGQYDGVSQIHCYDQQRNVSAAGEVAPVPGRLEITAAPDGTRAMLSKIMAGDTEPFGAGSGIRSELSYPDRAKGEIWYVWDVFFPTGFSGTNDLTFMQVHDTPDGGESVTKYPNFEFMTGGGYVYARVPLTVGSEQVNGRDVVGQRVPLVTGRWVTCALHTNWATDTSGFLEAWFDGKIVAREWSRACGYTDAVGPYLKIGLYDFGHGGISGSYWAWYRNVSVYSAGHGVQTLLGVLPPPIVAPTIGRIG